MKILTSLQAGENYTVEDLSKMFKTSRRTIFRDLKELQAIGVPYHYSAKNGGYSIDPEFFLPPIDLNLQEALSLLLLVHKLRKQVQLPYKRSALLAALKIENNLPAKIRQYCTTFLRNITTKAVAQAPLDHLDNRFQELQKAMSKKLIVHIHYNSLFEDEIIDVDIHPYHLLYNQRAWYLLGFSSLHKTVRTFKLNRIKEITILDKCFINDKDFNATDYLGRAWSMIPEGRIYNIRLLFSPKVASNVIEVKWHSTQKVIQNKDGSAIVEFRVDGLGEISWWILGYGDQVKVLSPNALRKRLITTASKMIDLNNNL